MYSFEPKKLALIRILEILQYNTSSEHKLTQSDISDILDSKYGIKLERKAISNNIQLLIDAGYDIETSSKGTYMVSNVFEKSEIRLLIDSVLCSRYLGKDDSKELINKLVPFAGYGYKSHVKHILYINEWEKTNNDSVLLNIEKIDDAIEEGKQIIIHYGKYNLKNNLEYNYPQKVSPYLMLLHNQKYYLMCYNNYYNKMSFLRIDKMLDIKIIDDKLTPIVKINGYEKGIDYKDLSVARPYMFADKSEEITIRCKKKDYDTIVDWFGFQKFITDVDDEYIDVYVKSSPDAIVYWAMQYGDSFEVIKPSYVREKIINKIKEVNIKYNV